MSSTTQPTLYVCHGDDEGPRFHRSEDTKLPALRLPDGTVHAHSKATLAWVSEQR